ncbi:IclR family transcriptional regulator [Halomonas sp. ISL-60]|uniref:IclR family transcriptional regulator n=1 Tax=unclassified Halomonas TaxID=2609666 RepID=UPI0007D93929|nr:MULTISPECIES: IclR family transcriptional regulator [unclassified Halomonas]MBT2774782.1 IclR family transcriptional regulator [Halomonas sp. ISL-60]MBT2788861.1 IclR family transcriptional regulator [Halomonas sp. ISL-106]MBT2795572.1 IclR family transcriptional regulator [Halomonas sp. ISL-104]MBT2800066.1 IclR family transcriptional regulator [Halomonas sp. ISL-56]OAL60320.1 IclR family transcriptional regulator [Halomonas sp. ALS9]
MHPTDTDADDPQLPGKDRNFVTALARGLELLRAFGTGEEYLGNAELSNRTNIPRPTVSRLTYTLTQLGYLQHNTHLEKYRLGPGVLALGYRFLANMGIREIARPHLQKFADATDCNVSLGGADRSDMVYLETCHGHGPLIIRLDTGSRLPIVTSAIGRAWLCGLSDERRQQVLQELASEYGDDWPQYEAGIQQSLKDYAQYGFCLSEQDWQRDISAVAMPLILEDGAEVMAINCGGSSLRLDHDRLVNNLGPRLKDVANQIKQELAPRSHSAQ